MNVHQIFFNIIVLQVSQDHRQSNCLHPVHELPFATFSQCVTTFDDIFGPLPIKLPVKKQELFIKKMSLEILKKDLSTTFELTRRDASYSGENDAFVPIGPDLNTTVKSFFEQCFQMASIINNKILMKKTKEKSLNWIQFLYKRGVYINIVHSNVNA